MKKTRTLLPKNSALSKSSTKIQTEDFDMFKVKKLPDDFAEQILNLELDIEDENVPIHDVNSLLELYAKAIEYYEAIHSNRSQIFMRKMQTIFEKPNVIKAMESENNKNAKIEKEKKKDEEKLAKKLFNSQSHAVLENSKLVNNDINSQKEMIEGRIKRRKKLKEICGSRNSLIKNQRFKMKKKKEIRRGNQ